MIRAPLVLESVCTLLAALRDRLDIAAQQLDGATAPDLAAGLATMDEACTRFLRDVAAYRLAEARHDRG